MDAFEEDMRKTSPHGLRFMPSLIICGKRLLQAVAGLPPASWGSPVGGWHG